MKDKLIVEQYKPEFASFTTSGEEIKKEATYAIKTESSVFPHLVLNEEQLKDLAKDLNDFIKKEFSESEPKYINRLGNELPENGERTENNN